MSNYTTLGKVAAYSSKRVPISTVTIDNYVTVDNLLQNKQGVVTASGMPSVTGQVPGYDNGNILVGNIRPYLKKIWFANRSGGASADVLVLSVKEGHSSKYVYYSMFLDDFFAHMMRGKKGTKMPRGDKRQVLEYAVAVHELPTQQRIAEVLSSLDNKIELNKRINAELESMAKTLYDYWFVQFDFPNANGKPYKSSGGKMVYNEALKRQIPKDWTAKALNGITPVATESVNPASYPDKLFKHLSIPSFDAIGSFFEEKGETIGSNKFKVRSTDILVSKLNPKFSRVVYVTNEEDLISSTEFVVWRPENQKLKPFLYSVAKDPSFITFCQQSASGTSNSHKRINPTVMMDYQIPYNQDVCELFGKHIESSLKKMMVNNLETKQLTSLRDWLLPMLMNGQVTVK